MIELSDEAQLVLLARQAMEFERRRKNDEPSEFVFRSYGPSGHVTNLDRSWRSFRRRAGIEDVHIHDLRRTLPSVMATNNISLPIIGKHLGHSSLAATQIYARLQTQAVAGAVSSSTDIVLRDAKKRPKLAAIRTKRVIDA
jgi:integrase